MLETLAGNALLKADLQQAVAEKTLSHGILLCGEEGCGCGYAARCLAADYLCPQGGDAARAVMEGKSSECIEIEGEGASGEIKIDRIREMRQEIFDTALSANGRVVIIYGAQHFNQASANALLKVLEEPPQGVVFLLTSSGSAAVLPTIRSRCRIYNMAPVSAPECTQWLNTHYPACPDARELSIIYAGCIGLAAGAAQGQSSPRGKSLALAKELAQCISQKSSYRAMILLAALEKDKTGARLLLEDLRCLAAAALRAGSGWGFVPKTAARTVKLCSWALEGLTRNLNLKLLLTDLALRLCR